MKLVRLNRPPDDLKGFYMVDGTVERDQLVKRLELLIVSNVKINVHGAPLEILNDVRGVLESGGYRTEYFPLPDDASAFGNFYLHPPGSRGHPG